MSIIAAGKTLSFIILCIAFVLVASIMWLSYRGKKPQLREMVQLTAIDEGIARAIETGRGVFYHLDGSWDAYTAPMTLASLNMLYHVAYVCAQRGADFIPIVLKAPLTPFADAMAREAAMAAGHPERYKRVEFQENAEGVAEYEEFTRHGVGLWVSVGPFYGNHAFTMSEARRHGGITIGGTGRYFLQGSVAIQADYPAFMEDIYALSAIVSGQPVQAWTLLLMDALKIGLIGLIALIVVLGAANLPILTWLKT